ncbi:type II toxin-antitoxin system VapB family antitoxin [Pedobacter sp. 22163]|uniref:type II toxin-antitoxin system VapB family antitoxin n=1 Tax=Pedobacter sp. 22163 TaxID=3453883 RepID=UPI003F872F96
MDQLHILEKIKMIPVAYQQEVEDFIDFILQKKVNKKNKEKTQRKLGLLKGKMKMSDDFNAPLDDFKDYM